MNILYIWDADYPWDIRVEKICEALATSGHNVHIASRNLKKRPIYENINGIHIHRHRIWKNTRINYFLSFPLFFSPVWTVFLNKTIKSNKIDLIIVRDLPMAIAGIWAGKRYTIPVVLDMAEDYVSMIRDIWKLRKFHGFNLIVRNPYFAKFVERYTFKHADHILVVIDEAIDVVIRNGGDRNKITIVSNTPKIDTFDMLPYNAGNDNINFIKDNYSVIYTGGIQMGRGIQTVINSIPEITRNIPNFLFVVVGDGYATEKLKQMINEKGLEKHVLWIGWVDHDEVFSYIKACDIGIIPHLVTEHVKTTIPNKIFDYMGCGIPVISSDAPPMKKILTNQKCGITFKSGDSKDLAKTILSIYNSTIDYGSNGIKAVKEQYNWENDATKLHNVVSIYKLK